MSGIKGALYVADLNTLLIFNNSIRCKVLDIVMPRITYLGSATTTISTCVMITITGNGLIRKMGIQALFALALSHLFVQLLKNSVCRLRPKDVLSNINTFDVSLDYYSFPSGHTTAAFAIAATLALNLPILAVICFPIALIIAISRLYLGVHYPSDVLAGMAIAILTSVILQIIINH
ncbi:phosphatase PAP2 family protein [Ruminiclostridium papyrosolvens]|uniref:PA-phosphatase n=1 Tax=Ruminiclostridium papyrosolvens C7 TaxID=1330534 RepID=U4QZ18_9FIRM|nr:phosphatase PAP2 family protein [Ruminiclostridium papyrosolvens]EPR10196.1 PA-phosphatase [Ruminiclostridium papyrosolvens C7]